MKLSDTQTRLSINPDSGEIESLQRLWRGEWRELIYRSHKGWRGGAPWLFPAVGRNFASGRPAWRFNGQEYPMPIHGIAMSRPWKAKEFPGAIRCRLESDASTRENYPFDFALTVDYSLIANGARAQLEVAAAKANDAPMPFSLGNHVTLKLGGDCLVRTPAGREHLLTPESLFSGNTRPVDFRQGVRLKDERCLSDGVLGGFPKGQSWVEVEGHDSFGLRLRQAAEGIDPEFFYFVFWGDASNGFLCPEPWYGGPNSLNDSRGVVVLKPGESFRWEMTLEFLQ